MSADKKPRETDAFSMQHKGKRRRPTSAKKVHRANAQKILKEMKLKMARLEEAKKRQAPAMAPEQTKNMLNQIEVPSLAIIPDEDSAEKKKKSAIEHASQ